jgi:Protein of unknown function (DUF2637)
MTTTEAEATMTQHANPTPEPLGRGWHHAIRAIGTMAALIGLGGMTLSFRGVSHEMIPAFGAHWAWLVPVVVDLTVFVFSGVDLVLNRLEMNHPLARWTVYTATAGTVYLNYEAGGNLPGRIAHILMPSIWVVFIELMRHVVRRLTGLANGTLREPIPAMRWLLSPWPTLKLWRRMVLWQTTSYRTALLQERTRLTRVAALREEHGPLWRWRVSALDRLSVALAEPATAPAALAATEQNAITPAVERPAAPGTPAVRSAAPEQVGQQVERRAPKPPAAGRPKSEQQSDDALECLTNEETSALNALTAQWAPRTPSQGAIRSALPAGPDGTRCGATRAMRIQKALRDRAEHPDDPDPLADAIDTELAAS